MSDINEEIAALEVQTDTPEEWSSEDDNEDENSSPNTSSYITSPSGELWTDDLPASAGRRHADNVMLKKPVITAYASKRIHHAHSSFLTIFDRDMLNTITVETNREGRRVKEVDRVDVTNEGLDACIGLCILRGAYKSNDEDLRELWNPESGRPIFRDTMNINRFEEIRRMLRFDNRATKMARFRNNKLAANRLLLDGLVAGNQKSYVHSECVTVDEELYPFRGRCPYVQ